MRFDDRLTTVLAQPAEDAHDRAVRWRQLVELLARAGDADTPTVRQATEVVRGDAAAVDEQVRAAAARAIAGLKLPYELIAVFAADRLSVAAPVLAAANLETEQWRRLHEESAGEIRGFIASLRPELSTAPAPAADTPPPPPQPTTAAAPNAEGHTVPSISELVTRIDRLRRSRDEPKRSPAALSRSGPSAAGETAMFRWEAGPSGEIAWVQGAPRGAIVGRSLVNSGDGGFEQRVERAFALRAPFRDALLSIAREGAMAGEWRVSGVPAFEPTDGRFAGYRGIAVRKIAELAPPPEDIAAAPDHDALRELVHEIKTPLNAIIGFGEIIEQQYLGPADHRYRERAAEIVRNARTLLDAIDDLDFAAKLQSGRTDPGVAADLVTLLTALEAELQERAAARGGRAVLSLEQGALCRTNAALAARLVRRFATTLADVLASGERLTLRTEQRSGQCLVMADAPKLFDGADLAAILQGSGGSGGVGVDDAAFWLRLVRGLARIAAGDLLVEGRTFSLVLPEAA